MSAFWVANAKKKPVPQQNTFTIVKKLFPATWTEVSLDLPAKEDEFQKILVSFNPKTINFEGDYKKIEQNLEMLKLLQSIR